MLSGNLQLQFPGHHTFQKATKHSQGGFSGRLFCVLLVVFVVVVVVVVVVFCVVFVLLCCCFI